MTPHPAARPADPLLHRGALPLGAFTLTLCTDGTYLLDGGAMFGVVPRTLWQQRTTPDADNRILLGLNCVLVRTPTALVLIETGIGPRQSPRMQAIHQNQALLPASLAAAGIAPADVTHVLNTHLHFDHCGWNTTTLPSGEIVPTFLNAQYLAPLGEVTHGRLQLERDRVSYLAPNYEPLLASGRLRLLTSSELRNTFPVTPGITCEAFPGHTASMMAIHIESGGHHACFTGDLFPTSHHLDPTWVMGYDLDPLTCIQQRHRLLAQAIPNRWTLLFPHDHHCPAATLTLNDKGKPVATPLLPHLLELLTPQGAP